MVKSELFNNVQVLRELWIKLPCSPASAACGSTPSATDQKAAFHHHSQDARRSIAVTGSSESEAQSPRRSSHIPLNDCFHSDSLYLACNPALLTHEHAGNPHTLLKFYHQR